MFKGRRLLGINLEISRRFWIIQLISPLIAVLIVILWSEVQHPGSIEMLARSLRYDALYRSHHSLAMELAIEHGDLAQIKSLLDKDPGLVNTRDEGGGTPLYQATFRTNRIPIMTLLLRNGAPVNAQDITGSSALHRAAFRNYPEAVELLLDAGADIKLRDYYGDSPLDSAARGESKKAARILLDYGADYDIFAATLLDDREQVLKLLKANPALVDSPYQNHPGTLLCYAVDYKLKDMAALLIKNGANLNPDISCNEFLQHYPPSKPLHSAAQNHDLDMAKLLLDNGARINARDHSQKTPLHLAAGDKLMTEFLLDKGADVRATNSEGQTPLFGAIVAASSRYSLGLHRGISARPPLLRQPGEKLVIAPIDDIADPTSDDDINSIKLLLAHNADLNVRDNSGRTPLCFAASNFRLVKIVDLLIAAGSDINTRDKEGQTPLGIALHRNDKPVVEVLRKHGATE